MAVQSWTSGSNSWTVPTGVTSVVIVLKGGDGGNPNIKPGGSGATVTFTLATTPGQVYTFDVGQGGGNNGLPSGAGTGGHPHGGDAGNGVPVENSGGGGAGASRCWLGATLIGVAGGGGGAANTTGANGGGAGALTGSGGVGQGAFGGAGGTQVAGGTKGSTSTGCTDGSSNQGGHGANNAVHNGAGGGGDGFFGGGGGGENNATGLNASGGGGGSSWLTATGTSATSSTAGTQGGGGQGPNGGADGSITITYNLPPNSPVLVSPTSGGTIDQTIPTTFSWNFSDPDSSDTQAGADFRWRVGAGAWNNVFGAATTSQSYTAPANTFTASSGVSVEWQVRTTDSHSSQGPYSASSFFTPEPEPATPTISPTPIINTNAPSVSFSTGYNFRGYQMRVVNDVSGSPGSTVLVDTGAVSIAPINSVSRTLPTYGGYANGTAYHIQVRATPYSVVGGTTAAWSPWADSGVIVAALGTPPLTPTLVLSTDPLTASISVAITNPGSDPHPPDHNDIYRTDLTHNTPEIRVATGILLNAIWTDFLPASNVLYRYRVVAVTAAGASASSA